MQTLPSMPAQAGDYKGLRLPQVRVLEALVRSGGMLTRAKLSDRIGNKTAVVVSRAVGYSDPDKRAAFEQTTDGGGTPGNPCPSLLTLGYVKETILDIDGLTEVAIQLTAAGRQAYKDLGPISLPPLRD